MNIKTCDRCESKILKERSLPDYDTIDIQRVVGDDRSYKVDTARLCSRCWQELHDWVFGDDTPDRSDTADPIPLERLSDGVRREKERLEGVLDVLSEAGDG